MSSNQPAANRREKMSLGHSHLSLPGKLQVQEASAQRVNSDFLGESGVVAQLTSPTTAVTLDARNGVITTFAGTLAADAAEAFTFTNKYLSTSSVLLLTANYGGAGAVSVSHNTLADGSVEISVQNVDTVALDAAVDIHFLILGGAPDQTP